MKTYKFSLILFFILFFISSVFILLATFKISQTELRLIAISRYIREKNPELMYDTINEADIFATYIKNTNIGAGSISTLLQLSLFTLLLTLIFSIIVVCKKPHL